MCVHGGVNGCDDRLRNTMVIVSIRIHTDVSSVHFVCVDLVVMKACLKLCSVFVFTQFLRDVLDIMSVIKVVVVIIIIANRHS